MELKSGVENGKPYITRVTYPVWRCIECKAVRSELIQFRCSAATLGSTSLEHLEELVNYVGTGLTTEPIEGFNNLLKLLKRVSFGIKRLDRFMCRLKLLYGRDIDIEALLAA